MMMNIYVSVDNLKQEKTKQKKTWILTFYDNIFAPAQQVNPFLMTLFNMQLTRHKSNQEATVDSHVRILIN